MKQRIAIIGGGLCGSVLSTLLRNKFDVTVIESGRSKRPRYNDINCTQGEINTSINRAEGLGGTTNYWHNALIELTRSDMQNARIDHGEFGKYYDKAWSLFLGEKEKSECDHIRTSNGIGNGSWTTGHMVVPYARANAWHLANARYQGDPIKVLFGTAQKVVPCEAGNSGYVVVKGPSGEIRLDADYFLICAGGLASPVFLSRSLGREDGFCSGYHDHPMAYVAKIKLRADSMLKAVSCKKTSSADVRSGFVFESSGLKTAFYLRPAINLKLKSITGPSRYVLSDLRNAPFSPKKIAQLLTNLDALKEAILFKTKSGFRGDYYSVLLLGEQAPIASRGISMNRGRTPVLNWHVTDEEHQAYKCNFDRFMSEFSSEIVDSSLIPPPQWDYRTAAHHSGGARGFLGDRKTFDLSFFAVNGLPNSFICDASLLQAGGIANSGLTLVALSHRLAELAVANL